jgi:hypothetical protein
MWFNIKLRVHDSSRWFLRFWKRDSKRNYS